MKLINKLHNQKRTALVRKINVELHSDAVIFSNNDAGLPPPRSRSAAQQQSLTTPSKNGKGLF